MMEKRLFCSKLILFAYRFLPVTSLSCYIYIKDYNSNEVPSTQIIKINRVASTIKNNIPEIN